MLKDFYGADDSDYHLGMILWEGQGDPWPAISAAPRSWLARVTGWRRDEATEFSLGTGPEAESLAKRYRIVAETSPAARQLIESSIVPLLSDSAWEWSLEMAGRYCAASATVTPGLIEGFRQAMRPEAEVLTERFGRFLNDVFAWHDELERVRATH